MQFGTFIKGIILLGNVLRYLHFLILTRNRSEMTTILNIKKKKKKTPSSLRIVRKKVP